jgi:ribosomal protein S18
MILFVRWGKKVCLFCQEKIAYVDYKETRATPLG